MGTRTVRLDDEAEKTLQRLKNLTGLSISEVLKRGLSAYESEALGEATRRPYDVYRELDLGEGGHAQAAGREAKTAVVEAVRRKHNR